MEFYQDIPRLYTAVAEWGACVVFLFLVKKEKMKSLKFWLFSGGVLGIQSLFLIKTGELDTVFWIPCMIAAAAMMYGYLLICGELSVLAAGYGLAWTFLLAEFTASLEWQLHTSLSRMGFGQWWIGMLTFVLVYGLCFGLAMSLEKDFFTLEYMKQLTIKEVLAAIGIVLVIFAFSNISFLYQDLPFTSALQSDIFYIRTLVDFGGLAVLQAYHSRINEYMIASELSALNGILKSQYDQYRNYQDSLDLIHMKYHDLKHQITGLRAETDAERRKGWLDAMEEEVQAFEVFNKTGNHVLDTILAAKVFQCRRSNIQITCVADGSLLNFIHVMDICSIFGNGLDNAIEHVSLIPEEEKRLIHVTVTSKKQFVFIKIENYCEGEVVKNKNNLIDTTKADQQYHGFGLKSIRQTVEKYGGTINFGKKNDWFELNILLPKS